MRKLTLFLGAWILLSMISSAQELPPRRLCGTDEHYMALYRSSAEFRNIRASLLNFTHAYALIIDAVPNRVGPISIPVVVHVVWHEAAENISDQQIRSQIDVLNQDFMNKNSDLSKVPNAFKSKIGNPNIEFHLATKDPQGAMASGITRTQTQRASFTHTGPEKDFVKMTSKGGHDPWPRDSYLNIWVTKLAGNVLGYATFPGEPADVDGVVITSTAFGTNGSARPPFQLGRTVTHEVGHWLNLFHIWGDDAGACTGSDQADDTPNQASENVGTPTFPHISCNNGPDGDMFMNYMDYSDDVSMYMFTKDQVGRIEATLNGVRRSILTSPALPHP